MKGHYKIQLRVFIEKELFQEVICETITDWMESDNDFPEWVIPFMTNGYTVEDTTFSIDRSKTEDFTKEVHFRNGIRAVGTGLYFEMKKKEQS